MKIIYKREDFPEPGDQYIFKGIQYMNCRDYSHALNHFEKASTYDNEYGLVFVGIFNLIMLGITKRNPIKALSYFKKAATMWENRVAQYFIGMMYFEGDKGVEKNLETSFEWLILAANNGWSDAMGHLANAYLTGEFIAKDLEKAITWLNLIDKMDKNEEERIKDDSIYLFGHNMFKIDMSNVKEEIISISEEATTKRMASFPIHSTLQLSLRDSDSDESLVYQAFWWDTMSNKKSNCVAASQLCLAKIFDAINKQKALHFYKKSAKNGNSYACLEIGSQYNTGTIGLEQDYKEAMKWYKKSKEADALFNIGILYYNGKGVKRDYQEALSYFSSFNRKSENSDVYYYMGSIYEAGGHGVKRDYLKAIDLYTKATERGSGSAAMEIGLFFYMGIGVNKNEEKAYQWFSKAAEMESGKAYYMLGRMHHDGYKGIVNIDKSLKNFETSLELGFYPAKYMLSTILLKKPVNTMSQRLNFREIKVHSDKQ